MQNLSLCFVQTGIWLMSDGCRSFSDSKRPTEAIQAKFCEPMKLQRIQFDDNNK